MTKVTDAGRLPTQVLTQLEFTAADHEQAARVAAALGYRQTAYTSTSALWGLFCLGENPEYAKPGEPTRKGCIIKTRELGLLFVQDLEDLGLSDPLARADVNRIIDAPTLRGALIHLVTLYTPEAIVRQLEDLGLVREVASGGSDGD